MIAPHRAPSGAGVLDRSTANVGRYGKLVNVNHFTWFGNVESKFAHVQLQGRSTVKIECLNRRWENCTESHKLEYVFQFDNVFRFTLIRMNYDNKHAYEFTVYNAR